MTTLVLFLWGYGMGLDVDTDAGHEAQTSGLAARQGALLLDYLRVRLPDEKGIMLALGGWLGRMVGRGRGWRSWYTDSARVLDTGIVAWVTGSEERRQVWGVLVDLPGAACAGLGDRLVPFLRWALEHGGHCTRLDFAIDDFQGLLDKARLLAARDSGTIVTRWVDSLLYDKRRAGKPAGWSLYLGSRAGESFVRIYDKALEQSIEGTHWMRFEFQTNGKLADAIGRAYFERGSVAVIEQVNRRLRFAECEGQDTNRRRLPTAAWWAEFIGSVEPGASLLAGEKPKCTIETMGAWLEYQAAPTMAALVQADEGNAARLLEMIERGGPRLRPKHEAAIAAYLSEQRALVEVGHD